MTEQEIKQNAKEYAFHKLDYSRKRHSENPYLAWKEGFEDGAHSRDEEVERIKNEAAAIMDEACALKTELNKLRNPWRDASVEKPPYDPDCDDETSVYVIVRQEQGNLLEAYYDYDNNDWRDREHNWRLKDPTHWMHIQKLPNN